MKIKSVHQFSAGFNPGDAISNQMLIIQNQLEKLGIDGEIYSENISPLQKQGLKFRKYSPRKGDCIIYHHSIHSSVLEYLLNLDNSIPKILIYHNVTPHEYFENYDLQLTYYLKKGREELMEMKDKFQINLAVSHFNKTELEKIGFTNVQKFPIYLNPENFARTAKDQNNKKNIIFTGRIAPNKKQEDLIKFAKFFYDMYDIEFELQLIGHTSRELLGYKEELDNLIRYLHLEKIVKFSGFVDQATLSRHYAEADVFLCLSEHEGFCVPIMEAMFHKTPILAFAAGAIPETLNGAGVLFYEKNFQFMARMVYQILTDQHFRETIVQNEILSYRKYLEYSKTQNIFEYISKF